MTDQLVKQDANGNDGCLMKGKPKKSPREKDLTSRYLPAAWTKIASNRANASPREQGSRAGAIEPTANTRSEEQSGIDIDNLPLGEVTQVYSRYSEVLCEEKTFLCVAQDTLSNQ